MSAFESHAFLCSVPNPEASRFAKQLACPGVDLDSWWSVRLPMQMFFKYEDHWEELNGDGTLQQKVFTTTLSLHMCSHGTTSFGVNWHGRGWHGVWQWLVPEQCFITVHVTIDVSFIPSNEKFQLLHILVSLNRTGSCVIVHAVANIPTGGPHWNCGSLAVLSQRRDGNHLQQKIIHYLRVL